MTTTVNAIYENGKLLLPKPLSLPEKSSVRVTIESASVAEPPPMFSEHSWPDFGQRLRQIYGEKIAPDSQSIIDEGRGDR